MVIGKAYLKRKSVESLTPLFRRLRRKLVRGFFLGLGLFLDARRVFDRSVRVSALGAFRNHPRISLAGTSRGEK